MMRPGKSERLHLIHRLVRGPAFVRHTVSRDHHSRTVVSQAAMHKNFFSFALAQNFKKPGKHFVPRPRTMPRNRHIFHPQTLHCLFFAHVIGMSIDYNVDPQLRQRLQSRRVQQSATIKSWRNLAKIRHAFFLKLAPDHRVLPATSIPVLRSTCLGRSSVRTGANHQQQKDTKNANPTMPRVLHADIRYRKVFTRTLLQEKRQIICSLRNIQINPLDWRLRFRPASGGTGIMMNAKISSCAICSKPLDPGAAAIDDRGLPVHEKCYALVVKVRGVRGGAHGGSAAPTASRIAISNS